MTGSDLALSCGFAVTTPRGRGMEGGLGALTGGTPGGGPGGGLTPGGA